MATKPSSPFEWITDALARADATRWQALPASWVTDGPDADDRFLHEYANFAFGTISDWTVYLDDLSIEQVGFGANGEATLVVDDGSLVQLDLSHTTTGVAAISLDSLSARALIAIGDQAGSPGTSLVVWEADEVSVDFARVSLTHVDVGSEAAFQADVLEPAIRYADADADTQASASPGTSLYRENVIKLETIVTISTGAESVSYDSSTAGGATSYGYNVKLGDTAPVLSGNRIRVRIEDNTAFEGRVHATLTPSAGTPCGICKMTAFYDIVNEWIELIPTTTSTADLTTDLSLVTGGAIDVSIPAGTYTISLLVF
jgi:hypothetical protein